MKYKRVIMILLLALTVGSNGFVYASNSTTPESIQSENAEQSLAELYNKAGLDSPEVIINTLAALGISTEELQEAVGQGKKVYDILQDKEITMVNFKKALTKEYKSRITQARKDKIITRKEAKVLTDLLKERMNQWEV